MNLLLKIGRGAARHFCNHPEECSGTATGDVLRKADDLLAAWHLLLGMGLAKPESARFFKHRIRIYHIINTLVNELIAHMALIFFEGV